MFNATGRSVGFKSFESELISFMQDMMPKVQAIRGWIEKDSLDCELEVDGGVNETTARICTAAGADVLVAGSAYFKAPDKAAFVRSVKG